MLFNSVQFLIFLLPVLGLYYLLPGHRWQNALLLVASYIFYAGWDWRFLGLIFASTLVDYTAARAIERAGEAVHRRRLWLIVSLGVNLGALGLFKYWDFGVESMRIFLEALGFEAHLPTLRLILPVGISFYTFQTISYTVDVYRGKREAVRDFWDFALYVAYFPQLVAGPIERSTTLLPQLQNPRKVSGEDVRIGCWWMLLGYFKKVVLADTLAPLVEVAFRSEGGVNGTLLLLGVFAFAVQVYGDFAGYSLIARGLARVMGIHLIRNFRAPYLADSPRDIWRRWHISLSLWLREYLYFSLGGSRGTRVQTYRNLLATMTLGGLWHGAGWNFVLWGFYHGLFLCADYAVGQDREGPARKFWRRLPRIVATFLVMCGGYFIFLSTGLEHLGEMVRLVLFEQGWSPLAAAYLWPTLGGFVLLMVYHIWQERSGDELVLLRQPRWVRWSVATFLLLTVWAVGFRPQPFFYFQF